MQGAQGSDPSFQNLHNAGSLTGKFISCFPKLEPSLNSCWLPAASSPDCHSIRLWEALKHNDYSYSRLESQEYLVR